jgi:NTE family protein
MDVVLSSGYLAFARQAGFLDSLEAHGVAVDALCGTSSGALVGALWAAGMPARDISREIRAMRPINLLTPRWAFWGGLFSLDRAVAHLRSMGVPDRFDQLPRPFAVGVVDRARKHHLLTSGDLPEAVVASAAIPWLFAPRCIDGQWWADGGLVDRTGFGAFRAWRGQRPALVHLVARSLGGASSDLSGVTVVHTPSSRASLFGLGPFEREFDEAVAATRAVLGRLLPG